MEYEKSQFSDFFENNTNLSPPTFVGIFSASVEKRAGARLIERARVTLNCSSLVKRDGVYFVK